MISKAELSNKLQELILAEMPVDKLTRGSSLEADEYFDILSDSITAVLAKMTVAYTGSVVARDPENVDYSKLGSIEQKVIDRLNGHIDYELNDLTLSLLEKTRIDA